MQPVQHCVHWCKNNQRTSNVRWYWRQRQQHYNNLQKPPWL